VRSQVFYTTAETGGRVITHVVNGDQQDIGTLIIGRQRGQRAHHESGNSRETKKKAAHCVPPFPLACSSNSLSQMHT
jgi:hypothetical protein